MIDEKTRAEVNAYLDEQWVYYTENRNEIVRQYRDKYVVISGGQVVASYDDDDEAYFKTIKKIPVGSFLIQHATDPEEVLCVPSFALL